jgi:2-(1,2-epoxy-1,2-dihydrophenyl)acetyl-CoA isomerase
MAGNLETRRDGRVLIVVNTDPSTRNALSWELYDALRDCVEAAGRDTEVGAIVLTGAGGFFSSGGNVNGLRERATLDLAGRRASVERLHAMIRAMRACPKPIIAAVEGGAAGAGASLALACDMIVAARDAYLSIAYVKIGLTPDGGATAFLGRSVPRQFLAEMAMTGDRIPVERLHTLGVINALTAPGAALDDAAKRATALAAGPPEALASIKRLIEAAPHNTMDAQLDMEADNIAQAIGGAEAREGIAAFLEKRPPAFRND